jgi:methylenetetrahydrofolate reductase (NADPH)
MNAKPEHVLEIGVNWTVKQVEELLNKKVPAIHFYIMQNSTPIKKVMSKLGF